MAETLDGKVKIGSCPHCGSPVFTHANWLATTPPPNFVSCSCPEAEKAYRTQPSGPLKRV